ncbi:MAG: hypothetical protein OXC65_00905 [Thiotrichales bacterium]|nr:hypothetical protein [Thiotrichales bacterium]
MTARTATTEAATTEAATAGTATTEAATAGTATAGTAAADTTTAGVVTVKIVLSTGTSVSHTGGEKEFEVEARNLRGVIKAMDARFPGLGAYLEEETTVAIDGQIHETAYFQRLNEGAEVYFLPKIEAG